MGPTSSSSVDVVVSEVVAAVSYPPARRSCPSAGIGVRLVRAGTLPFRSAGHAFHRFCAFCLSFSALGRIGPEVTVCMSGLNLDLVI